MVKWNLFFILKKKLSKDRESYEKFWENFGPVLKEGIYEDFERKDSILEISLFDFIILKFQIILLPSINWWFGRLYFNLLKSLIAMRR